ncbi:MAG: Rieske 2Fe-2S domain-containing protein [Chloroflexota bacterium]|nr:Rieske 2Fe-2S domain-containing protein [Chloroflexota bacterium]
MTDGGRLTEEAFHAVGRHLDELVREFEALPLPQVREQVFDLLQTVDALHRAGLTRLTEILRRQGAEAALERAAEDPIVRTLLVLYDLAPEPPPVAAPGTTSFIPLDRIGRAPVRAVRRPVLAEVARVEEVPPGTMKGAEVEGIPVLLANVAGTVYAVRNVCPGSVVPLSLGSFTPPVVVCPWHNEAFDVRTGKRADGEEGPGLGVLPLAIEEGAIKLAVATAAMPTGPGPRQR